MARPRKNKHAQKRTSPALRGLKIGLSAAGMVLQDLASIFGHAAYAAGHNYNMGWAEYEDLMERRHSYEEQERLRDLKQRKLIATKKIGSKLMVRLTEKGWRQALRDRIRCAGRTCKERMMILVIFDVPESERFVRDTLRAVLSDCGFTMVQKSVWVTRKDVVDELCALLQGSGLNRWVRIIVGNELKKSLIQRTGTRLGAAVEARRKNEKVRKTSTR